MITLLCVCNFTVAGESYEAWCIYRIPSLKAEEVIDAECDTLRLISERLKAKKLVFGTEIGFTWQVLTHASDCLDMVNRMVPPMEEGCRWSMRIHKMEV